MESGKFGNGRNSHPLDGARKSCVANNVGLIQFAVTVIVLHSWESMYSKQREYAILLVTSDFIRVTNFIYP